MSTKTLSLVITGAWAPPRPRSYVCRGCGHRLAVELGGIGWVNDEPYCHPLWPQVGIRSCYQRVTACRCTQYRARDACDCDDR